MEVAEGALFAARRLAGTARSRFAEVSVAIADAAARRASELESSSSFSGGTLAALVASAPLWVMSLSLAGVILVARLAIGSVASARWGGRRTRRKQRERRRSGAGDADDVDFAAAPPKPPTPNNGRYGLIGSKIDEEEDDDDGRNSGYDDGYESDPDDSATTLASRKTQAPAAVAVPSAVVAPPPTLLHRQTSVVSRGEAIAANALPCSPPPPYPPETSRHVARLEASPEFKQFLERRGLTRQHAAAAARKLGAFRELREADRPSFKALLLATAASSPSAVEGGVEAAPLGATELLVDSLAGSACGAFAALWWLRLLCAKVSTLLTSPAPPVGGGRGVPPLLAAATALSLLNLASAAVLGRPFLLSALLSSLPPSNSDKGTKGDKKKRPRTIATTGRSYWWEDSRGETAGTPSSGKRAATAVALDALGFGAATLGLGCAAGLAARLLGVRGERSSLGERFVGVRLVREQRYEALEDE